MSNEIMILVCGVSLVVLFLIVYGAIRLATADERKLIKIQTALMANMALKQGVKENDVDAFFIAEGVKILR